MFLECRNQTYSAKLRHDLLAAVFDIEKHGFYIFSFLKYLYFFLNLFGHCQLSIICIEKCYFIFCTLLCCFDIFGKYIIINYIMLICLCSSL